MPFKFIFKKYIKTLISEMSNTGELVRLWLFTKSKKNKYLFSPVLFVNNVYGSFSKVNEQSCFNNFISNFNDASFFLFCMSLNYKTFTKGKAFIICLVM